MTKRANPSEFWCEKTGISWLPEDRQTDRQNHRCKKTFFTFFIPVTFL